MMSKGKTTDGPESQCNYPDVRRLCQPSDRSDRSVPTLAPDGAMTGVVCCRHRRQALHRSRSTEPDGDALTLHDDRHVAAPEGVREHPLKAGCILLDVDVLERNLPLGVVLTGRHGVRSGILSENVDHLFTPSRRAVYPDFAAALHPSGSNAASRSSTARKSSGIGTERPVA